jgi:hypothetical protein
MFQGVERLYEITFCILGIEESDIKMSLNDVGSSRMALRNHLLLTL